MRDKEHFARWIKFKHVSKTINCRICLELPMTDKEHFARWIKFKHVSKTINCRICLELIVVIKTFLTKWPEVWSFHSFWLLAFKLLESILHLIGNAKQFQKSVRSNIKSPCSWHLGKVHLIWQGGGGKLRYWNSKLEILAAPLASGSIFY